MLLPTPARQAFILRVCVPLSLSIEPRLISTIPCRQMPSARSILPRNTIRLMASNPPPIAPLRPHNVPFGGVEGQNRGDKPFSVRHRTDDYFWLRDDKRENEEVLSHLRAENAYTAQQTTHLEDFRQKLYDEHVSHLKETDEKPPYPHGPFYYYTRTVKGLSYVIHCRKRAGSLAELETSQEEIILDVNKVAEGKAQCVVQGVTPSPDHTLLAYSVDFTGNETYTVVVLDLATGEALPDVVEGVAGGATWGMDKTEFYYTTEDHAKRPWKLWRHTMGNAQSADKCLVTEEDELFYLSKGKTKDGKYLISDSSSTETSEMGCLDLQVGGDEMKLVQPRQFKLRYEVEHYEGNWIIWTNLNEAINNRLMTAPVGSTGKDSWTELIPYDPARKISYVEVFKGHLVVEGREQGLTRLWTMKMGGEVTPTLSVVSLPDDLYEVETNVNKVYDTDQCRINYSSLTTPLTWYNLDLNTGSLTLVKQDECLNFDSSLYTCRRTWAKANDGSKIPISLVHRKDLAPGPQPCMLYGYGSYGICIDPSFSRMALTYLDRGMVYAIAHIRGGGEMGQYWYEEQGKYLNKRNTFSDFINCAEHLIEVEKLTKPDKLAMEGRSAGGLLMGSVLNMRPDLFKVAVAGVPFVDVMNTMSDATIPLTTGEWEEWGNPNEAKFHDYMLSYSPYENVRSQPYPYILITAGLHDPRVAYWEPAKWAQKLRACSLGSPHPESTSEVLLKMDLEVGHFSASDRYKHIRERSFEQAVVLWQLGLVDVDCVKSLSSL